jgi:hypothetical protein
VEIQRRPRSRSRCRSGRLRARAETLAFRGLGGNRCRRPSGRPRDRGRTSAEQRFLRDLPQHGAVAINLAARFRDRARPCQAGTSSATSPCTRASWAPGRLRHRGVRHASRRWDGQAAGPACCWPSLEGRCAGAGLPDVRPRHDDGRARAPRAAHRVALRHPAPAMRDLPRTWRAAARRLRAHPPRADARLAGAGTTSAPVGPRRPARRAVSGAFPRVRSASGPECSPRPGRPTGSPQRREAPGSAGPRRGGRP